MYLHKTEHIIRSFSISKKQTITKMIKYEFHEPLYQFIIPIKIQNIDIHTKKKIVFGKTSTKSFGYT